MYPCMPYPVLDTDTFYRERYVPLENYGRDTFALESRQILSILLRNGIVWINDCLCRHVKTCRQIALVFGCNSFSYGNYNSYEWCNICNTYIRKMSYGNLR